LAAGAETTIKSSTDNMSQTDSSEFEGIERKISPPFGGSNYGGAGDAETGNAGERRTRPCTLLTPPNFDIAKNKRNRGERQQFSMERVRRWSMAPVSSDVLVKMGGGGKAMEKGKFRENGSSSSGSSAGRKQSVVAIRGIDFVQVFITECIWKWEYFGNLDSRPNADPINNCNCGQRQAEPCL
jgi:hypothetical protein